MGTSPIARPVRLDYYQPSAVDAFMKRVYRNDPRVDVANMIRLHASDLAKLNRLLSFLTAREGQAVVLYHCLEDEPGFTRTIVETAAVMEITPRRVESLLNQAGARIVSAIVRGSNL